MWADQLLTACARKRISHRGSAGFTVRKSIANDVSYRGVASETTELNKTRTPYSVWLI